MRLNIRAKLFLGFALAISFMAAAMGYLYYEIYSISSSYNSLIEDRVEKISLSKGMMAAFSQEVIYVRSYLFTGDSQYMQKYYNSTGELTQLIEKIRPMARKPDHPGP